MRLLEEARSVKDEPAHREGAAFPGLTGAGGPEDRRKPLDAALEHRRENPGCEAPTNPHPPDGALRYRVEYFSDVLHLIEERGCRAVFLDVVVERKRLTEVVVDGERPDVQPVDRELRDDVPRVRLGIVHDEPLPIRGEDLLGDSSVFQ